MAKKYMAIQWHDGWVEIFRTADFSKKTTKEPICVYVMYRREDKIHQAKCHLNVKGSTAALDYGFKGKIRAFNKHKTRNWYLGTVCLHFRDNKRNALNSAFAKDGSKAEIITGKKLEGFIKKVSQYENDPLDVVKDIRVILQSRSRLETNKNTMIQARLGQGKFRKDVEKYCGSSCVVTGCRIKELLRASHIKPWSKSNHKERLDPFNGFLLEANLDALFDRGLLSFTSSGQMMVSGLIPLEEQQRLKISNKKKIRAQILSSYKHYAKFLDYHRRYRFKA